MNLADFLDHGAIAPRASAPNKRQALALIADIAARNFGLEAAPILEALTEREQAGSTGVGYGVAVPHAKLEGLERMRAVFVRLEHPVEFGAMDDQPVDLCFALFSPPGHGSEHLQALARVSRLMRQKDLRDQLRQARVADAIHVLLAQEARPTAA